MYFAPEHDATFSALGLRPGRMSYFAGRAAPMGAVGAGVVTATFYNFSPSLVAHMIPRAWTLASPEQVVEARWDVARASLTRLLGEEAIDSAGVRRAGRAAAGGVRRADPRGPPALRRARRPALARRAAAGPLARGDAAARAPRRRTHRGAAARRPQRPGGADHAHRHRPRVHAARRPGDPRAGGEEEWAAESAALVERGLLDDAGLTAEGEGPARPRRGRDRRPVGRPVAAPGCRAHRAGDRAGEGFLPPAGRRWRVLGRGLRRRSLSPGHPYGRRVLDTA